MKIGMFFQEITSITEFPGINCLLPIVLIGRKWELKVANLLLLISNPDTYSINIDITTNYGMRKKAVCL